MSLNFNGATDQVDFGSASSLDDLATATVMFIFRPTTLDATFRYLYRKIDIGAINIVSHDNFLEFTRVYGTTNLIILSSTTISINNWYIAFFVDGGAGVAPHLYLAQLGSALAEVSYTTQQTPVGTLTSDAGGSLLVGFRDDPRRFIGDIALISIWTDVLSLNQCSIQYRKPILSVNSKLLCYLGYNGTGSQIDWSGNANNGTVTGTAIGNGAGIIPYTRKLRPFSSYAVAAVAGRIWKLAGEGGGLVGPTKGLAA